MKVQSKQVMRKPGVRQDQLRIISEEIDKMQEDMQKALESVGGDETKKTSVKLIRSRRETRVFFTFKGGPEETEERLQKVYKSLTG